MHLISRNFSHVVTTTHCWFYRIAFKLMSMDIACNNGNNNNLLAKLPLSANQKMPCIYCSTTSWNAIRMRRPIDLPKNDDIDWIIYSFLFRILVIDFLFSTVLLDDSHAMLYTHSLSQRIEMYHLLNDTPESCNLVIKPQKNCLSQNDCLVEFCTVNTDHIKLLLFLFWKCTLLAVMLIKPSKRFEFQKYGVDFYLALELTEFLFHFAKLKNRPETTPNNESI